MTEYIFHKISFFLHFGLAANFTDLKSYQCDGASSSLSSQQSSNLSHAKEQCLMKKECTGIIVTGNCEAPKDNDIYRLCHGSIEIATHLCMYLRGKCIGYVWKLFYYPLLIQ